MATAKRVRIAGGQPSRWKRNILLLGGLIAVLLVALGWSALSVRGRADASFAARTACVCRYVSQRALDSCKADLGDDLGPMHLSEDDAAKSVTARYLTFARQTAKYDPGRGCRLQPWDS